MKLFKWPKYLFKSKRKSFINYPADFGSISSGNRKFEVPERSKDSGDGARL